MHVAFVSNYGCGVGIAMRLQAEGHTVLFWTDPGESKDGSLGKYKLVGEGIVPKATSWDYLYSWAREHARRGPTIMVFEGSGMGKKADGARGAGLHVIGSGTFCDKLENDRLYGFKVAEDAGCSLPPYEDFTTISDAIAFAHTLRDMPTYWKTDKYLDSDATRGAKDGEELAAYLEGVRRHDGDNIHSIIQKKIEGTAISTARWWNGRSWVGRFESTIEHKKAYNDELGPSTGCSFNAVWTYEDDLPPIAKALCWDNLTPVFLQNEAPPGIYDINAVVDDEGNAHFLEWTPRMGWDSEPTSFALLKGELGAFLWSLATGTADGPEMITDLAYSIRLGVPPYPWEHWSPPNDHHKFKAAPLYGIDLDDEVFHAYQVAELGNGLAMASPEGLLGLVVGTGKRLSAIHAPLVGWIQGKKSGVPGLGARTDGAKCIAQDARALNAGPLTVPEGLTR